MKASVVGLVLSLFAALAVAQTPAEPPVAEPTPDYGIGIEDVLQVSVWGESALTVRARVRPDGKITVPLVNDIKVEGMSPDQVRIAIARRLASFIREPNVTVSVEEINSFRVYVLGEVNRQGPLNFNRPTRLLQAIAAAGGLTQFSKKGVVVLREQDGAEQRLRVDYKRMVSGDPTQQNLYLKPGDIVLVD